MRHSFLPCALVLASSVSLGGCLVPARQMEEANSALKLEQRGHRQTAERNYTLAKRVDVLERQLKARQARIDTSLDSEAQSQFDYDVALKQREEAEAVVEQLRGELARVGTHLKSYASEKERLAQELQVAEGQASKLSKVERASRAQLELMRDLSVEFYKEIKAGSVRLGTLPGGASGVTLSVRAQELLDEDGLSPLGSARLARLAKLVQPRGDLSFKLDVSERGGSDAPESALLRLSQVAEALAQAGLGSEQVIVSVDGADSAGEPKSAELSISITAVTKADADAE